MLVVVRGATRVTPHQYRRYNVLSGDVVRRTLDGNSVVYVNSALGATPGEFAGNRVKQIHVASYPANAPIEDSFAVNRIRFDAVLSLSGSGGAGCGSAGADATVKTEGGSLDSPDASSPSDTVKVPDVDEAKTKPSEGKVATPFSMFSVFDGHWAPHCSSALSQILPVFVQDTIADTVPSNTLYQPSNKALSSASTTGSDLPGKLQSAFIHCDASLLSFPFSLLPDNFFDLTNDQVKSFCEHNKDIKDQVTSALLPAVTGSCALSAIVRDDELVLANVGDCRAVLGTEGPEGKIVAKDLTRDHNGENESEVTRLQNEHPSNEKDTVIFVNKGDRSNTKRVLGGLMPTRSFGDAKYKWPLDVIEKVDLIEPGIKRAIPMQKDCKTPPYLTATPEITEHRLTPHDRFLVLATDGLYDQLSSVETAAVVADLLRVQDGMEARVFPPWMPKEESTRMPAHLRPTPVRMFVDCAGVVVPDGDVAGGVNLATSLVRAALIGGEGGGARGGGAKRVGVAVEEAELRAGLEPGEARNVRDDITVIVMIF